MKYKKSVFAISICISVLLTLAGCGGNKTLTVTPDDYISFTTCEMATYDAVNDQATYEGAVFEYNLGDGSVTEIFRFPLSAMYALGVYDKKTNSVYYSKEGDNDTLERRRTGDQIFAHDLATGSDKQLTEGLLAVNYIIPVDDAVFFIAAKQSNPDSLVLGKINLTEGSVQYWDEPDTSSTHTISVDRSNKRMYVGICNADEDTAALVDNVVPKHTICSFDYNLRDKREIISADHWDVNALYTMDNWLLYRMDDTIAPMPNTQTTSTLLDLDTMKVIEESEETFSKRGRIAPDKKGSYRWGDEIIEYFDFETKTITPLTDDSYNVANFELMYTP